MRNRWRACSKAHFFAWSLFLGTIAQASAGFEHWTTEQQEDPFSGGIRMSVDYDSSARSGVSIVCDTSGSGFTVRVVPGYDFEAEFKDFQPTMEFAIDGKRLSSAPGTTRSVGDNLTAIDTTLDQNQALMFATEFSNAMRQVAIQDGLSDRPHLLEASGSTMAGKHLLECLDDQSKPAIAPVVASPRWEGLPTIRAESQSMNAVWNGIFDADSLTFSPPKLVEERGHRKVVFRGRDLEYDAESQTIIVKGAFAAGQRDVSDLAYATAQILIAKSYGKHVQNLTGITAKFIEISSKADRRLNKDLAARVSVQQACFSGLWYHFAVDQKLDGRRIDLIFRRHDNDDASNAELRARWFQIGASSGKLADCDTFNNPI